MELLHWMVCSFWGFGCVWYQIAPFYQIWYQIREYECAGFSAAPFDVQRYLIDMRGSDSKSVCLQCGRPGFYPWVGKIPRRRKWQPTPVFLPGKSHGQRSLACYSPWGCKESDTTERFHFTSILVIFLCISLETHDTCYHFHVLIYHLNIFFGEYLI